MKTEGWEKILHTYIEESRLADFEWGVRDCCLWVASYVDLVTGSNHASEWAGQYNTANGAKALMESKGFNRPADIADSCLQQKPITYASRGDVVEHPDGALGICTGRKSLFMSEAKGLVEVTTLSCVQAWAV